MRLLLLVVLALLGVSILLLLRVRSVQRAAAELNGLARFRELVAGRYPDVLIAPVYAFLAERHGDVTAQATVTPGDDLARVHRLAALDLEDAVVVIADRAGARLPGARELDTLSTEVRTVEDLLRFLEPYFRGLASPS